MRFSLRRNDTSYPSPEDESRPDATEALQAGEKALDEAKSRWPAVIEVVTKMNAHRNENHFGDRIAQAYRSRPS